MKKRTLAIISVVAVMVLAVGGILAYLTDTAKVTNTFTVGNVDIELDEAVVDEEGKALPDGRRTEEGNEYHLIPGIKYDKDPTVTVKAKSEKSYVRMMMAVQNASAVDAIIAADDQKANEVKDYADLFDGWAEDKWIYKGFEKEGNTIIFEFRYFEPVDASEATADIKLPPLFTQLVVPGFTTVDLIEDLYTGADDTTFKVTVTGHAIQAAGFEAANGVTAEDAAWAAFDAEMED